MVRLLAEWYDTKSNKVGQVSIPALSVLRV